MCDSLDVLQGALPSHDIFYHSIDVAAVFVLYNCFFLFHSSLTYCTPAENKPREIKTTRDRNHALFHVLFHVTRPNHALVHVLFHVTRPNHALVHVLFQVTRPNHALFHVLFHATRSCLRRLSGSCGGSIRAMQRL